MWEWESHSISVFARMSDGKRSVGSGLTAAVLGAGVAGLNVQQRVEDAAADSVHVQQDVEMSWDDEEERRYREWLREERQRAAAEQPAVDWKEYEAEEAHRARMRAEMASMPDSEDVEWSDAVEREFRRKYVEMRKAQASEEANWDEYRAEEEHRERMRKQDEARRKASAGTSVKWDDAEERRCQQRYRKKYSHH